MGLRKDFQGVGGYHVPPQNFVTFLMLAVTEVFRATVIIGEFFP